MNCSETKSQFGFYLDETLPDGEMQELKNHLGECTICSTEIENLEKIESVIQAGIYPEPDADYWNALPRQITQRIGIRPRGSAFEQFRASMQGVLAVKGVRWGFAGAFAAAILIFTLSRMTVSERIPDSITQNESVQMEKNSAVLSSEVNDPGTEGAPAPQVAANQNENSQTKKLLSGGLPDVNLESSQEVIPQLLNTNLLALNRIESKPLRTAGTRMPGINEELYPIPNTEFILPPQESDGQDGINPLQKTFALNKQDSRSSKTDAVSELPDEIKRIRSGFLETLWIVQESHTLGEKKNIWVSYINRESDITYRYLGVYNLALVLSEITERSNDIGDAAEARDFFIEHEKALRFQMGDERFDIKLGLFDDILN